MADVRDDKPVAVKKVATNQGTSARGVNTVAADGSFAGTVVLQPGESQTVMTSEAEMAGATGDILYEDPGAESGDKAAKAKKAKAAGSVDIDVDVDIDAMSDDELHDFLEKADGRKRPANTSRSTLVEQAQAAQAAAKKK